jgi:hypothetical protein
MADADKDLRSTLSRLHAQGNSIRALAARFHLSKSRVGRMLQGQRAGDGAVPASGDRALHGWVEENGHLFFLLPLPEYVRCPGCGQSTNHLEICWECRRFYALGCADDRCGGAHALTAFETISELAGSHAEGHGSDED